MSMGDGGRRHAPWVCACLRHNARVLAWAPGRCQVPCLGISNQLFRFLQGSYYRVVFHSLKMVGGTNVGGTHLEKRKKECWRAWPLVPVSAYLQWGVRAGGGGSGGVGGRRQACACPSHPRALARSTASARPSTSASRSRSAREGCCSTILADHTIHACGSTRRRRGRRQPPRLLTRYG